MRGLASVCTHVRVYTLMCVCLCVCVQMVETSTAKATEMALKLHAVHRWCVSGTPISRGLEDLYGLVAFLGVRPWANRTWWNRCGVEGEGRVQGLGLRAPPSTSQ